MWFKIRKLRNIKMVFIFIALSVYTYSSVASVSADTIEARDIKNIELKTFLFNCVDSESKSNINCIKVANYIDKLKKKYKKLNYIINRDPNLTDTSLNFVFSKDLQKSVETSIPSRSNLFSSNCLFVQYYSDSKVINTVSISIIDDKINSCIEYAILLHFSNQSENLMRELSQDQISYKICEIFCEN